MEEEEDHAIMDFFHTPDVFRFEAKFSPDSGEGGAGAMVGKPMRTNAQVEAIAESIKRAEPELYAELFESRSGLIDNSKTRKGLL